MEDLALVNNGFCSRLTISKEERKEDEGDSVDLRKKQKEHILTSNYGADSGDWESDARRSGVLDVSRRKN